MSDLVTYEFGDGVATIAMDDGKVNALSLAMFAGLNDALDRAEADRAAAVVLAGRPGRFSAGFDLQALRGGGTVATQMLRDGFELSVRLLSFPAPVVIACTGHAIAMGLFLVLSGDHRVAADGPVKLTANEVAIGMTLPFVAVELCRYRLTPQYASRTLVLAEVYTPADAVRAGLVDRVVPADDVVSEAVGTARQLAALDQAAHLGTKLRVRQPCLDAMRSAIDAEFPLG